MYCSFYLFALLVVSCAAQDYYSGSKYMDDVRRASRSQPNKMVVKNDSFFPGTRFGKRRINERSSETSTEGPAQSRYGRSDHMKPIKNDGFYLGSRWGKRQETLPFAFPVEEQKNDNTETWDVPVKNLPQNCLYLGATNIYDCLEQLIKIERMA